MLKEELISHRKVQPGFLKVRAHKLRDEINSSEFCAGDTESIRTINEQLFQELEELIMQYRTLRTYVEQLGCNYKKSKDMLILHRYSSLKAMIKLLVVQSKTLAASSALTASKPTVIVTNCDSAESSSTPRRSSVAVGEFALQRKLSNKRNEAQRKRNERREGKLLCQTDFSFSFQLHLITFRLSRNLSFFLL